MLTHTKITFWKSGKEREVKKVYKRAYRAFRMYPNMDISDLQCMIIGHVFQSVSLLTVREVVEIMERAENSIGMRNVGDGMESETPTLFGRFVHHGRLMALFARYKRRELPPEKFICEWCGDDVPPWVEFENGVCADCHPLDTVTDDEYTAHGLPVGRVSHETRSDVLTDSKSDAHTDNCVKKQLEGRGRFVYSGNAIYEVVQVGENDYRLWYCWRDKSRAQEIGFADSADGFDAWLAQESESQYS